MLAPKNLSKTQRNGAKLSKEHRSRNPVLCTNLLPCSFWREKASTAAALIESYFCSLFIFAIPSWTSTSDILSEACGVWHEACRLCFSSSSVYCTVWSRGEVAGKASPGKAHIWLECFLPGNQPSHWRIMDSTTLFENGQLSCPRLMSGNNLPYDHCCEGVLFTHSFWTLFSFCFMITGYDVEHCFEQV